jgi:hypothetical protein
VTQRIEERRKAPNLKREEVFRLYDERAELNHQRRQLRLGQV